MGIFLDIKAANSVVGGSIWPKFELVRDFMHVLVTRKYKKDRIKKKTKKKKKTRKGGDIIFPHYKSVGTFCCHGNQSFDPICPKTLCSLSPTPMMLHIQFDKDRPAGFRDIQVQMCEIFVT